ncbi:MAG: flavohemoglobin expression-modulating QEGLA motif protein [Candidatus Eisenbacteria bacterium]
MITIPQTASAVITARFVDEVSARIAAGKRVRRNLPKGGRVHIDRPLPFLCVYRRPARHDDPGTDRIVTTEASYLVASGASKQHEGTAALVRGLVRGLAPQFGAFLLLEIWAADSRDPAAGNHRGPYFRIHHPRSEEPTGFIDRFESHLTRITVRREKAGVIHQETSHPRPRRYPALLSEEEAKREGCVSLGLEVSPIYRDARSGDLYPQVLRDLRRGLTRALRLAFYDFMTTRTTQRPAHFHVLGRRGVVKAVWEADRLIADVSDRFDFLLQVTPTNSEEAWNEFRKSRFEKAPLFHYRPLPADPVVLKRTLYAAPVERIEDPALYQILREKQDELDRKITMLTDLNKKRFLLGSIQVYGDVGPSLNDLAHRILERISPRAREASGGGMLDAEAFAEKARREIAYYHSRWPDVAARVSIRDDVVSGLMVSRGGLLIGRKTRIPEVRAEALLQHEVGTHVLTYYNGLAQPFRQLYSGLADYETLQEGLAVLAEYLVGGLSRPRLRLLAARVSTVRDLVDGATFVDAYRALIRGHGVEQRTAFTVAMRIYRGGGLTKDAVYLKGLQQLLRYLGEGGDFEPLFVGKVAAKHAPVIRELLYREVLRRPPLAPRYLEDPKARERLKKLSDGRTVLDLIERRSN